MVRTALSASATLSHYFQVLEQAYCTAHLSRLILNSSPPAHLELKHPHTFLLRLLSPSPFSGNMRLAVQLPPSEELNEWLAVNSECTIDLSLGWGEVMHGHVPNLWAEVWDCQGYLVCVPACLCRTDSMPFVQAVFCVGLSTQYALWTYTSRDTMKFEK